MQREREVVDNPNLSGTPFGNFGGLDFRGSMFPSIFGGRDPFDDPFFTRPFSSVFGSSVFDSNSSSGNARHVGGPKGPIIKELDSDDERELAEDDDGENDSPGGDMKDKYQEMAWENRNPVIEHPEDRTNDHGRTKSNGKDVCLKISHNKAEGSQPQTRSVRYQRVTYGGINGAYYTASRSSRTGSDGMMLEESKQADRTTGQATHRVSRGIHDKGHTVTRKLDSSGDVNTMQTLHNLDEDELGGFEQAWKGNADKQPSGRNPGFGETGSTGHRHSRLIPWSGFADPFSELFGRGRSFGPSRDSQSSQGRPKKVVTINIE